MFHLFKKSLFYHNYQMKSQYKQNYIVAILVIFAFAITASSVKVSQPMVNQNIIDAQPTPREIKYMIEQGNLMKMFQKAQNNQTYKGGTTFSNMLVTPKYALIVKYQTYLHGALEKLNFKTMKMETVTFKRPFIGFEDGMVRLADLKNGDIAVGQGRYIYIFHNETLKLKQTLFGDQIVKQISSRSQESSYLIRRGDYKIFELQKDPKTNQYVQSIVTYDFEPPFNTFPTGQDTAITINTIRGCQVTYWNNIDPILKISYNPKDYLQERVKVAVSNSQSFFVVKNMWTHLYEVYNLEDTLQITLTNSVMIDRNTFKKGGITNDDRNLLVSTFNTETGLNYIAKLDLKAKKIDFLSDKSGDIDKQIDFNLFDSKYNRFVTLVAQGQDYFIQLRSLEDLTILDEYPIHSDSKILALKLIGSISWDLSFSLVLKTSSQKVEFDSRILSFEVESDKIINLNIEGKVSFYFVEACAKYVITNKINFDYVKVLHSSNYSVASIIYTSNDNYDTNFIIIQKNILTFTQYFGGCQIYDLQQSLQRKSILYKDSQRRGYDNFITILFPKRGLLYETPQRQYALKQVTKAVYDISKPSVSKIFNIDGQLPCQSPAYYTPSKDQLKLNKDACNLIFFVQLDEKHEKHYLGKYSQCTQKLEKILIEDIDAGTLSTLSISSDNKYIIMVLLHYPNDVALIEVRPISDITHIVYHYNYPLKDPRNELWFDVDFVNQNMILLHPLKYLSALYIEPNLLPSKEKNDQKN